MDPLDKTAVALLARIIHEFFANNPGLMINDQSRLRRDDRCRWAYRVPVGQDGCAVEMQRRRRLRILLANRLAFLLSLRYLRAVFANNAG
jgi:hypothetical protein